VHELEGHVTSSELPLFDRPHSIYTIIKTTSVGDARLSVVGVVDWAWSTHAMVSASQEQTLSGRGARVYTAVHTKAGWAWSRVSVRPRLEAF